MVLIAQPHTRFEPLRESAANYTIGGQSSHPSAPRFLLIAFISFTLHVRRSMLVVVEPKQAFVRKSSQTPRGFPFGLPPASSCPDSGSDRWTTVALIPSSTLARKRRPVRRHPRRMPVSIQGGPCRPRRGSHTRRALQSRFYDFKPKARVPVVLSSFHHRRQDPQSLLRRLFLLGWCANRDATVNAQFP